MSDCEQSQDKLKTKQFVLPSGVHIDSFLSPRGYSTFCYPEIHAKEGGGVPVDHASPNRPLYVIAHSVSEG